MCEKCDAHDMQHDVCVLEQKLRDISQTHFCETSFARTHTQNSDNVHGEATYYTVGIKWPKPVNKFNRCKCREHLVLTQGPCRCHMLLVHVTLVDINRLIAFLCSTNDRCCMHASNLIHRCLCVMHALIEHICCTLLLQAK